MRLSCLKDVKYIFEFDLKCEIRVCSFVLFQMMAADASRDTQQPSNDNPATNETATNGYSSTLKRDRLVDSILTPIKQSHYDILAVKTTASFDDIRKSYLRLSRHIHPGTCIVVI